MDEPLATARLKKEVYEAVQRMIAADAEACAVDVMLYGRTLICMTPDNVSRVPPEDWHALADDIVISSSRTE